MIKQLLKISGLRMRIGEVEILKGVDASLNNGQITAFIGPNGAGKTTLFHAITGELVPTSGKVFFGNEDITHHKSWEVARLGVGKFYQDVRVFKTLSVINNVVCALQGKESYSLTGSLLHGDFRLTEARAKAELLLDKAGVEGEWDGPAGELSWGNQKLLSIARLLAGDFRIIFLDEPVAGVAPAMADKIRELIIEMAAQKGVTVALIEHDMEFVSGLADSVIVMRDGQVFDHGPAKETLSKPENIELCLGL